MSDLNRLRELAALFKAPVQVSEAANKDLVEIKADFDNIMDKVIAMLDRGGRVERALAKVKHLDKDMNLVKELSEATSTYKKKIQKLLDEADIMLSEGVEPDPDFFEDLIDALDKKSGFDMDGDGSGTYTFGKKVVNITLASAGPKIKVEFQAQNDDKDEDSENFAMVDSPVSLASKIAAQVSDFADNVEWSVNEAKNHMGETEYQSIAAWKRACKTKHPEVWYHPDDGTIDAFVGPKPFKQGETKQVGYWDDTVGTVN